MNYKKIYDQLINKRKNIEILHKSKVYCEKHHIIPKSLGGNDDKNNLVNLTAREHYIAHKLLQFYYKNKFGKYSHEYIAMHHALWQMSHLKKYNKYISSREYDKRKIENAQFMSIRMSGENNPRYNKPVSQHTRQLISIANTGRIPWMKGKKHSTKSRKLMKEHAYDRRGDKNPMYGKHHDKSSISLMKEHAYDRRGDKNPMYGTNPQNFMSNEEIIKWKKNISISQSNRIWIHKNENNKIIRLKIKKQFLQDYLNNGYIIGKN